VRVCVCVCECVYVVQCCNPNESCTYLFFIVGNSANAMTTFCTVKQLSLSNYLLLSLSSRCVHWPYVCLIV